MSLIIQKLARAERSQTIEPVLSGSQSDSSSNGVLMLLASFLWGVEV
jgi:hypothetical protein